MHVGEWTKRDKYCHDDDDDDNNNNNCQVFQAGKHTHVLPHCHRKAPRPFMSCVHPNRAKGRVRGSFALGWDPEQKPGNG